jgi:outer membrane protein OmpA-like peptidoglycan-associated protein
MKTTLVAALFAAPVALVSTLGFVHREVKSAAVRLDHPGAAAAQGEAVAIADHTEASYCTPQFKTVLQRVLNACGLVGQESRRGCQPADVKTFASISDEDFNALFTPLEKRGAIVMFDDASEKLDDGAKKLLQDSWDDRRGARYFFIVARASKTGTADGNRALSHKRANSVQYFLQEQTHDPDLEKQVGMLWLGSEFAQLSKSYCESWTRSREGSKCDAEAINRSAFVSWVDCRL